MSPGRQRRRPARPAATIPVALLAAALGLTGCDGDPRPEPSATALPDGITATLAPSSVSGQVLVRISNSTGEEFEIGSLQLDDPRFAWPGWARSVRGHTVAEGTTSLVSVSLPDARCAAAAGDGTRLTVRYALGASIAVASAAISDPKGVVSGLVDAECGG